MLKATGIITWPKFWPDPTWDDSVHEGLEKAYRGTGPVARIGMIHRHDPATYKLRNQGGKAPKGFIAETVLTVTVDNVAYEAQVVLGMLDEMALIMGVDPTELGLALHDSLFFRLSEGGQVSLKMCGHLGVAGGIRKGGPRLGEWIWEVLHGTLEEEWKMAWEATQANKKGEGKA